MNATRTGRDVRLLIVVPPEVIAQERDGVAFGSASFIKRARVLPPLGPAYLVSTLHEAGFQADLLDANALEMGIPEIEAYIRDTRPDIVGVTVVTPMFTICCDVAAAVKRVDPTLPVLFGGPHVTLMPDLTLVNPHIDFGIQGDAEEALPQFLDAFARGGDGYESVPGLVWKSSCASSANGQIHTNPPPQRSRALDTFPPPAREDLPNDRYFDATTITKTVTSMITARGCPFSCSFCERHIRGGHYDTRSPENVVDEIEHIVREYGLDEIVIYDDTFTANQQRAEQICDQILARELHVLWDCRTRVDCVNPGLLKKMKAAGCQRISYGIEAFHPEILKVLNKSITMEQAEQAFRWTRDAGINILAYFILGSPGETREMIEDTVAFSRKLNPDFAYYSIAVPYPATDLYDLAIREGYLEYDYWREYVLKEGRTDDPIPFFESPEFDRTWLNKRMRKAFFNYYFRPAYIWGRLKKIHSWTDFAWHVKMAKRMTVEH